MMPIFEYRCRDCGAIQEVLVTSAASLASIRCNRCGSIRLEKLLSAAAVVTTSNLRHSGRTCCGREERCDSPPCSSGSTCGRKLE
ncbi:MAG: FmdB family zinc ribbon protein [Syntrophobacteria bacterium]